MSIYRMLSEAGVCYFSNFLPEIELEHFFFSIEALSIQSIRKLAEIHAAPAMILHTVVL